MGPSRVVPEALEAMSGLDAKSGAHIWRLARPHRLEDILLGTEEHFRWLAWPMWCWCCCVCDYHTAAYNILLRCIQQPGTCGVCLIRLLGNPRDASRGVVWRCREGIDSCSRPSYIAAWTLQTWETWAACIQNGLNLEPKKNGSMYIYIYICI